MKFHHQEWANFCEKYNVFRRILIYIAQDGTTARFYCVKTGSQHDKSFYFRLSDIKYASIARNQTSGNLLKNDKRSKSFFNANLSIILITLFLADPSLKCIKIKPKELRKGKAYSMCFLINNIICVMEFLTKSIGAIIKHLAIHCFEIIWVVAMFPNIMTFPTLFLILTIIGEITHDSLIYKLIYLIIRASTTVIVQYICV